MSQKVSCLKKGHSYNHQKWGPKKKKNGNEEGRKEIQMAEIQKILKKGPEKRNSKIKW